MFRGRSKALTQAGIDAAAGTLGVGSNEIWAILMVETGGVGFLPDRRPQILYERHYFHRLTRGKFDTVDSNLSAPNPGGYGEEGAHQYDRLERAMTLDRQAAIASASWGLGQIMGRASTLIGFTDVESMVNAMMDSEDAQLAALSSFVRMMPRAVEALKANDWWTFAKDYNGRALMANFYDRRLFDALRVIRKNGTPDLLVRAAQLYLTFLGHEPGPIDGVAGPRTKAALAAFQTDVVDAPLVARLEEQVLKLA
jgi:hypothetical protein